MKINAIRFKNINSLKGVHEVNFDESPFDQSKLFAITGPTGSGKSTLLDVITLSLYNKIPRYTKGKNALTIAELEKHGSILTRGTQEAYTEIEYTVKEVRYCSKWMLRTNRNGKLVGPKMELSNYSTKEIIEGNSNPKVIEQNESIIGLSYEQFIKSILLSQGAFDKFLKSDKKERGLLLEKITGVDIYRKIGIAAFDRYSLEEKQLNELKSRLDGIILLSEEEIETLTAQEKSLDAELVKVNENILNVQRHLNISNQVIELRKRIEQTKDAILQNGEQAAAFKSKEDKLLLHQRLIAYKSDIVQYQELSKQLSQDNEQFKNLKSGLNQDSERIQKQQVEKERFNNELNELLKKQEEIAPIVEHVKLIDTNISKEEIVVQKVKELFNQVEHKKQQLLNNYNEQKKVLDNQKNRHTLLVTKLDANPLLAKLKNDELLLKDRVAKIEKNDEIVHLANLEWQKVDYPLDLGEISPYNVKELKELQLARNIEFKELKETLTFKNIKELDLELDQVQNDLTKLQTKVQSKKTYNQVLEKESKLILDLEETRGKLAEATKEVELLEVKKEHQALLQTELQSKYERGILEERFESLRKDLKEGEPCPLCGSLEHPLDLPEEPNPSNLKEEIEKVKSVLENMSKESIIQLNTKASLESSIKEKEALAQSFKKELNELRKSIGEALLEIDFQEEINKLNSRKESLLACKKSLLEVVEWERASLVLDHVIQQLLQAKKAIDELDEIGAPYSKYFDGFNVREWPTRINELVQAYEKANDELNELDLSISASKGRLDEIEFEMKEETARLASTKKELSQAHSNLQSILSERKALFGDNDPDKTKEQLRNKIELGKDQLNQIDTSIKTVQSGIQIKKEQADRLSENIESNKSTFESFESKINSILKNEEFENLSELVDSFLTDEELMLLEKEREEIKTFAIRLNQELKSAEEQLSELKDFQSEVSIDTLNIQFGKLKIEQDGYNQEKGKIFERLRNDRENRRQCGEIVHQIESQEKEYSRWKMLKEYIGDKTGDKFSIFAQELTLMHLIELANRRLRNLDDRYVLKKYDPSKKEEDIIVMDTYQGNAQRSVRTLSGGETFMISLAMALSLSDLASQNVKIDSLFIDEGFGTLDDEALDKALSTLEQLQINSEKMIGIISHVPALKERINTQIQLNKNSNGFSELKLN